jgi:arabinogalactan oligomer/maltooligosaccharide transport system permease protein
MPAIVVAALVAFLLGYSEFVMGWLFVDRSDNVTLAMAISALISGDNINASWSSLAALAVMMSVPVILLFLAVQRYLTASLLTGRVDE